MGDLKSQLQRIKATLNKAGNPRQKPEADTPVERSAPTQTSARKADASQQGLGRPPVAAPATSWPPKIAAYREAPLAAQAPPSQIRGFKTIKRSTLTRQSTFKEASFWVDRGSETQYTTTPRGRAKDIFIGFDFGTAYTKVAVGLLDKVFPVDWNGVLNLQSHYLLPTEYSVLQGQRSYLGQHSSATPDEVVADLKVPFIDAEISEPSIGRAAVFVALVLLYVRAWVYENHGAKLGESMLRWHLNIGAPSNGFEEDSRTAAYRRLAHSAWRLSLLPQVQINYAAASRLLGDASLVAPRDLVESDVVPEFVAQLSGYTQSAQRQNGLHALIDVGGGTIDMVTFNVHHADGEDVFPFFVPKVEPLGTYGMLANRFGAEGAAEVVVDRDVEQLISEDVFASATGISIAEVQRRDQCFSKNIASELAGVLHQTRHRRYRLAPSWTTGLRTFVTGGGSNLTVYQRAIRECSTPGNCPLVLAQLPTHPKLDGYDGAPEEYHRLSVACGLATNRLSLGAIVPASLVEDDVPVGIGTMRTADRPDRDELYAR